MTKYSKVKYTLGVGIAAPLILLFLYFYLWSGIDTKVSIKPVQEVYSGCYLYQSNADILNIAQHLTYQTVGKELYARQLSFKIEAKRPGRVVVISQTMGMLKRIGMMGGGNAVIIFNNDQQHQCLKLAEPILLSK